MIDWNALGAVGEIAGALAVIASLLYLSMQVKAARVSEKKIAIETSYYSYDTIRAMLIENEDVARIFMDGLEDPDRLTSLEVFRFMALSETMFLNSERYWTQIETNDDDRLDLLLNYLSYYLSTPGGQAFWKHPQSNNIDAGFRKLVESREYDSTPRLHSVST